jgi:hypothetical protein
LRYFNRSASSRIIVDAHMIDVTNLKIAYPLYDCPMCHHSRSGGSSVSAAPITHAQSGDGNIFQDATNEEYASWDQWLLITLPPAPGEAAPAITLPLADQIPPTEHWADEMNAKVLIYDKSRGFAAIWGEFTTTRDLLLRRVAQLSDADLTDPAGMAATIGQPVAPLICGIYEHYEEHAHELERLAT